MKRTLKTKLLPLRCTGAWGPLGLKKSKARSRQGKDCGGRAGAHSFDMERLWKERPKASPGTKNPTRQRGKELQKGDVFSQTFFIREGPVYSSSCSCCCPVCFAFAHAFRFGLGFGFVVAGVCGLGVAGAFAEATSWRRVAMVSDSFKYCRATVAHLWLAVGTNGLGFTEAAMDRAEKRECGGVLHQSQSQSKVHPPVVHCRLLQANKEECQRVHGSWEVLLLHVGHRNWDLPDDETQVSCPPIAPEALQVQRWCDPTLDQCSRIHLRRHSWVHPPGHILDHIGEEGALVLC